MMMNTLTDCQVTLPPRVLDALRLAAMRAGVPLEWAVATFLNRLASETCTEELAA